MTDFKEKAIASTMEEDITTLELLRQIEEKRFESQRSFANQVGIAVGLANSYIKRCVRKGWIKMSKTPARRYAYFITPKGFGEKSRLTADYLASSFRFYRLAREQCLECLRLCEEQEWRKVALFGTSELAEIAALAARELGMELALLISEGHPQPSFADLPVKGPEVLSEMDAVLITDISHPQEVYDRLAARIPEERILTPRVLNISRAPRKGASMGRSA